MGRSGELFITIIQRAETSVIDGAIRIIFAIRIGMKNLIRKFQDSIWVSKDESI